jgi:hypothetical protein
MTIMKLQKITWDIRHVGFLCILTGLGIVAGTVFAGGPGIIIGALVGFGTAILVLKIPDV